MLISFRILPLTTVGGAAITTQTSMVRGGGGIGLISFTSMDAIFKYTYQIKGTSLKITSYPTHPWHQMYSPAVSDSKFLL